MTAAMLAPTECTIAELALVLLLGRRARLADGGRRVGGHERHVGGGHRNGDGGLQSWAMFQQLQDRPRARVR